eukprot:c18712_g1_i1.p1 GENE.c18712_g1_i1~~c18712_g1_i1.p1  ORF type:complete len:201 (+),score=57.88 c18712_g1_i1:26-604(+)
MSEQTNEHHFHHHKHLGHSGSHVVDEGQRKHSSISVQSVSLSPVAAQQLDFSVPFLFLLFLHLFLLMITFILVLNTSSISYYFVGFLGGRALLAGIGFLSAEQSSPNGLLFYIIGQIISLGFESHLLLRSLMFDTQVTCNSLDTELSDIFVKEKILSFSFIIATCLAAARLRGFIIRAGLKKRDSKKVGESK